MASPSPVAIKPIQQTGYYAAAGCGCAASACPHDQIRGPYFPNVLSPIWSVFLVAPWLAGVPITAGKQALRKLKRGGGPAWAALFR